VPGYSVSDGISGPCNLPGNPAFANDFHVYAVEWTTNQINFFVDNRQYFSVSKSSIPGGTTWVYTKPEFVLLNLAVGGGWPGNPDGTTTFPQQMLVDYVRVYAPTNLLPAKTNLLSNPGFESAHMTNWTSYGAGFNTIQDDITNVVVRNGEYILKVFGQFNGIENFSGAFQDVHAFPGEIMNASGWAFTASGDQIAGPNSAWVEVSFHDASSNLLAVYRSPYITSASPAGFWLNCPVTNQYTTAYAFVGPVTNLVAPTNTSFARCQLVFDQPVNTNGSVYFDDLKLTSGGATAIPVPVKVARTGTNLNLAFDTYLNLPYQINWKNLLTDSTWSVLTNLPGTGASQTVTVGVQSPSRFFTVSRLCN
jgi:hypothetical protein